MEMAKTKEEERERDEYEEDDICVGAIKMSWESDVFGNGEN